ncbi:MAG TPA: hypothetical protein VJX70_12820 [Candidatus Acidoferrum sp.]|nr:hypothetical protein [Candidatus Acidoferrum sp.]
MVADLKFGHYIGGKAPAADSDRYNGCDNVVRIARIETRKETLLYAWRRGS